MTQPDETTDVLELYCPGCGYDLRAIGSERCPECGQTIDRSTLGRSIIPWVQRARLGTYRAFWRTVWMATLRPRQFGKEMNCPAHLSDARKFRWMVVAHAVLPLVALLTLAEVGLFSTFPYDFTNYRYWVIWAREDATGSAAQILLILGSCVLGVIGLYAITGVASFFFAPRKLTVVQQNRAIAVSYYSCAPMTFMLLSLGMGFATMLLVDTLKASAIPIILLGLLVMIGLSPLIAQPIAMLRSPLSMLGATTHQGIEKLSLAGVLLPILWVLVAVFFVVLIPVMLFIGMVVLLSFRT